MCFNVKEYSIFFRHQMITRAIGTMTKCQPPKGGRSQGSNLSVSCKEKCHCTKRPFSKTRLLALLNHANSSSGSNVAGPFHSPALRHMKPLYSKSSKKLEVEAAFFEFRLRFFIFGALAPFSSESSISESCSALVFWPSEG